MKVCPVCGVSFAPRGRQIYCERRCQLRAHFKRIKADPTRYARLLEQSRASYARNPETSYLYSLNWRARYRERVRHNVRGQAARRRARVVETDRVAVAEYVAILRGDPCAYCGEPMTVIDHIDAIASGGRTRARESHGRLSLVQRAKADGAAPPLSAED